jgi:hypothetical protein
MSSEAEPDMRFVRPRPASDDGDEPFRQSLAELSRQLASRTVREPPPFDPKAGSDLPPEPREPARRYRRHRPGLALLALATGVGLAAVVHALVGPIHEPSRTAAPTPTVAAVVPAPPSDLAPPTTAELKPIKPATADPPPPPVTPVAAPEPPQPKGKLEPYEILEIQTRLKATGLNPGPLDGLAGGQTSGAVKQYEATKGQPQTGKLDRDLLGQLRREPQHAQQ